MAGFIRKGEESGEKGHTYALVNTMKKLKDAGLAGNEMHGAKVALTELDSISRQTGTKWWASEECFNEVKMKLWKNLREQGDFGFVEILPGGKVNTEGPYLEGVKKALDEAEKVLGEKWGRQEPLRAAAQK